jgi:cytochrome b subunit of formate dehydrogenase
VIVPKKHSRTGFTTTLAESFGRETVFRWQGSFLYSSWFHWITPGCFVLPLLSGLSMFNPMLFRLSGLFGGGQSTIHPWIGTVLLLSYAGMVVQFWRDNMWDRDDIAWMRAVDRGRAFRRSAASVPARRPSSDRWRCWSRCSSSPAS